MQDEMYEYRLKKYGPDMVHVIDGNRCFDDVLADLKQTIENM